MIRSRMGKIAYYETFSSMSTNQSLEELFSCTEERDLFSVWTHLQWNCYTHNLISLLGTIAHSLHTSTEIISSSLSSTSSCFHLRQDFSIASQLSPLKMRRPQLPLQGRYGYL